ncbi:RNA polymerase sigma factor [Candidatus Woesebacteria bacterium]|nr:RNA polymerase sigma factor [Candidatus Woesebacteria bacterium]
MQSLSDKELAQQIIVGNEEAFHVFFNRHRAHVLSFITRRLRDERIAEEIVQDVFIDFLESLRDFRFQCKVKTFLFTIARNKSIDYIRKKKLKTVLFSKFPQFVVEGLARVFLDNNLEKEHLQSKIQNTFAQLPREYVHILRLKYIEGKSVQDIAALLSKTFKSTESQLYRARKAFIAIYNEQT